jgi:osmoprotectant transport system substrate-binding protein
MRTKERLKKASLCLLLLLLFVPMGCRSGSSREEKKVVIGSKHFTEQEILGEIMAQMIEGNTDIKVERRFNLGGTMVCFNAIRTGDIDMYAEYTGTGLVNILGMKAIKDADETYGTVKTVFRKKFGLVWLPHLGFNNTYTLTMRKAEAARLGVKRISDLARYAKRLQPGFDAEFLERPDGYRGLSREYGFDFRKDPKQMDPGLMYKALAEKAVDVIDGFATDGRIPAYHLVMLQDDRGFFPPYYAAPVVREQTIAKYPGLVAVLGKLGGLIDNEEMQRMNFSVDREERRPADVAREFLERHKLVKVATKGK